MIGRERFVAAARGDAIDRPPIWFMRQAGRYLPEYRKLREGNTFMEACTSPEMATEITLQPIRRFDLDAAVIFSDILVPLHGMGRGVGFPGGEGPRIERPVRTPEDVDELPVPDPDEHYPYVAETIRRVRDAIPDKAVLGFAGAPWTLACYLVEGGRPDPFARIKHLMYAEPDAFRALLDKLADTVARHLESQIEAGATAVQLFDTWAEQLSLAEYREWCLPSVKRALAPLDGKAVRVMFARGTAHLLPALAEAPCEVLSVDWRLPLTELAERVPDKALQGNLDPTVLAGPPDVVARETRRVLEEGRAAKGHIFNLGHGIFPTAPLESVEAMVRTVQNSG